MSIRDKAHIFLKHYEYMNNVFQEKFGYKLYFIGGTLLGYIRENDFLVNDKDMDVSYLSKYSSVSDVRKELTDIVFELIESGEQLYFLRSNHSIVKNYFRWKVDEKDRIDVMPSWYQEGMLYRATFVGYKGGKDIILPLSKARFYEHNIYIPNKPEIKLSNVYGADWRVPDSKFNKHKRKNRKIKRIVDRKLAFRRKDLKKILNATGEYEKLTTIERLKMFFSKSRLSRKIFRNIKAIYIGK